AAETRYRRAVFDGKSEGKLQVEASPKIIKLARAYLHTTEVLRHKGILWLDHAQAVEREIEARFKSLPYKIGSLEYSVAMELLEEPADPAYPLGKAPTQDKEKDHLNRAALDQLRTETM